MTVRELLERTSSAELAEWIAFEMIEPFGERRMDMRFALWCALYANAHRGRNRPPFQMKDFMLNFEPKKKQSIEEMRKILYFMAGKS